MKRNIRFVVIAAVVILLFGGAALTLWLTDDGEGDHTPTVSDILLYNKTNLDAEEITIQNDTGEFTLLGFSYAEEASKAQQENGIESSRQEYSLSTQDGITPNDMKMHYTLQGYEQETVNKSMSDVLAYQCSYVTALKIVDKSGQKYADYGLDKPVATVTVVFSDNSREILYIGNDAPDHQGVYLRRDGNANVYLTHVSGIDSFYYDALQFLDNTLTAPLNEEARLTEIKASGKGIGEDMDIVYTDLPTVLCKYLMVAPRREVCSADQVYSVGESVYDLSGFHLAAAQITPEDVKKYGLAEPYLRLSVTDDSERTITLLLSEENSDGNCYMMIEGDTRICIVARDAVSQWYDLKPLHFYAATLLEPNPSEMTEMVITVNDESLDYLIHNEKTVNDFMEEIVNTTITLDGKEVGTENIERFIRNVSKLPRGEYTDTVKKAEPVFRCVFRFGDDQTLAEDVQIYRQEDGKYIVTLNGYAECYVDPAYAEALIAQVGKINGEEQIESLYDAEKSDEESSAAESSSKASE